MGAHRGRTARGDLRGEGRGGQGGHDQAGHPVPQPAHRQDRRPAGADRAGTDPVVLPALRGPPAGRGRDRAVRPQLVQPRRGRARDGVLHQGGVQPVPAPVPDLRAAPGRGGHPAPQVLVLGQRLRAGAQVPLPPGGPDAALEALPDGPGVDHPVGGLLPGQGRDVRAHRHSRGTLVRGGQRGQAARADQHDRPPARHLRLPRRAAPAAGASAAACPAGLRARPARVADLRAGSRRGAAGRVTGRYAAAAPPMAPEAPMLTDLPLSELRGYAPDVAEPADFDEFWSGQLAAARAAARAPVFTAAGASGIRHAEVFDVTFSGFGGDPVKGWLLVPHQAAPRGAVIVEYIGYGGGRGDPLDWLPWSCAGYVHLVMDTRGQGGGWRAADTPDPSDNGAPSTRGFLTRGIADPRTHYYTRLFTDAACAVVAARSHPAAAGLPLVTTGGSQGGGLAIVAAHLAAGVRAAMPDVPFLAHPRRALEVTDTHPYEELAEYCRVHSDQVEAVFTTLSYADVVNHAKRAQAPALFSVGLADDITPPSTVFAAFNHYAGPKDIAVYEFSGHEGGGTRHLRAQLDFLAATLAD